MKPTVTLRWRTFGFGLMLALGVLLAIMPDNLARGTAAEPTVGTADADGFAIDAATLARWLDEGQPVGLIDVRERWAYDEFHIDGARHVEATAAAGAEGASSIAGSPVVVVARDDVSAAWVVASLRRNGVDAWGLRGGLEAFWDTALRPVSLDRSVTPERLADEAARRAVWRARYLGTNGDAPATATPAAPPAPIVAPAAPAAAPAGKKGRRGKGC